LINKQLHSSKTIQPRFQTVIGLCKYGNEEIACEMLWSGAAYYPEQGLGLVYNTRKIDSSGRVVAHARPQSIVSSLIPAPIKVDDT
jgi:hypothetical protein